MFKMRPDGRIFNLVYQTVQNLYRRKSVAKQHFFVGKSVKIQHFFAGKNFSNIIVYIYEGVFENKNRLTKGSFIT